MDRAYAVLQIKSVDRAARTFAGIATTPTPDRSGDILDPLGATFTNPVPLLWHHDRTKPIGSVTFDPPTAAGVTFTATIPDIPQAGALKDRLDEAYQSIDAGLIRGVSVGFRVLGDGLTRRKSADGFHIRKSELCELSLVTVPANADATILTIKSCDAPYWPRLADPRPALRTYLLCH